MRQTVIHWRRFWRALALRAGARAGVLALALAGLAGAAFGGSLVGSKHDLTSFNQRAGVEAMTGLAFNDYRDPCIYCHVPDSIDASQMQAASEGGGGRTIPKWNRFMPEGPFELYESENISKRDINLGAESLLCLSCHDGTMAVDMVVVKPSNWSSSDEAPLHMRLDKGGGLDKCTQCHNGQTAHQMDSVLIGRNLMDNHPVGVKYAGFRGNQDYFLPRGDGTFRNGVKLFNQQVECATCHDVHNPDNGPFLRVEASRLCLTCHNK